MMKVTLYAQPIDMFPRLNIRKLKKGVIASHPREKASHLNEIKFTDISRNILELLKQKGYDYNVKLLNTKFVNPSMNWSVKIETLDLIITLRSRAYLLPPSFGSAAPSMCVIIEVEGDEGIIENLISEYLRNYNHSPCNITNWDKFEKKFGITKKECIAAWEKYRQ